MNEESVVSVCALQLTRAVLHQLSSESDQGGLRCSNICSFICLQCRNLSSKETAWLRSQFVIALLNVTILTSGCQVMWLVPRSKVISYHPIKRFTLSKRWVITGTAGKTEPEPDFTSGHIWTSLWSLAAIKSTGSLSTIIEIEDGCREHEGRRPVGLECCPPMF